MFATSCSRLRTCGDHHRHINVIYRVFSIPLSCCEMVKATSTAGCSGIIAHLFTDERKCRKSKSSSHGKEYYSRVATRRMHVAMLHS